MIQREEKLCDVKGQGTCYNIPNLLQADKVSKSDFSISCRSMLKFTKLALVDEVVWDHMELETITNDFLNKFSQCIEEDNESEGLRHIVWFFIGFWNNDSCGGFEVR